MNVKLVILKLIFFILFTNMVSQSSMAKKDIIYKNNFNSCEVTASIIDNYEPENFHLTNNLLHQYEVNQFVPNKKKIIIIGRVLDKACVPVSDVKIYLWQVDDKGKYRYKPLKSNIDTSLVVFDDNDKIAFTGNGIATTNNKGEFFFITIYPASIGQLPPSVHIRLEHRLMGVLQTKLVLNNSKIVDKIHHSNFLKDLIEEKEVKIYNFEIVMPAESNRFY